MVNNSNNINKTNIHPTPQTTEHKIKKTMTYSVLNPGPGLRQTQKCGGLYTQVVGYIVHLLAKHVR